jgi:hypothetical protein
MKNVPNLIFYLHKFCWNFSQCLAIYFELFSSRVNLNSEIADEWAHLSNGERRARPAQQRAVAAWLPRAARPDSPAPTTPPPDRLARTAVVPTASPVALSSRPSSRTDRRGPKPPTPSVAVPPAARPSTSHCAAVPAPVSRPFLGRLLCAGAVPPLAGVGCLIT